MAHNELEVISLATEMLLLAWQMITCGVGIEVDHVQMQCTQSCT